MESSSSSRSKRQRLMVSYVSLRPDLPATFESLNDDSKRLILQFVGNKSYRSFASLNKHCKEVYLTTKGMTKETFLYGYAPLSRITDRIEAAPFYCQQAAKGVVFYNRRDVLAWALEGKNELIRKNLLNWICAVAAREERFDILDEVLSNLEDGDDKEYIFEFLDTEAAQTGRLDVLKWYSANGLEYNKQDWEEEAAYNGQLCVLQWLAEEQRLELSKSLFHYAVRGSQLHVMKWLTGQRCPWADDTFIVAFREANTDVLDYIHNVILNQSE